MSFIKSLGLVLFTEEEFYDFCNIVNGIKEFQFDFSKDAPEKIFELFPEFK